MNNPCETPRHFSGKWQASLVSSFLAFTIVSIACVLARAGWEGSASQGPSVVLKEAPPLQMPGVAVPEFNLPHESDCNSPVHWDTDTLYVFNSYSHPWRSAGPDLFHLGEHIATHLGGVNDNLSIWIESTWKDENTGVLYGAYHYEPDAVCFSNKHLPTMPRIGWLRSQDNGLNWEELGFIIEAERCALRCDTASPWDAGGTGDFVFLLDEKREYFYFYGTSYDSRFEEQGIWVARMKYADRDNPSGKVMKWHQRRWDEPGLWGHVTPVFPAEVDYHRKDGAMFWGPAIHWNTYLNQYVMLLNHAIDTRLNADGIYVSYNTTLGDPTGWGKPVRILDRDGIQRAMTGSNLSATKMGNGWYPQVIGTVKGETDKRVGRSGRFFMAGYSTLEISFSRADDDAK